MKTSLNDLLCPRSSYITLGDLARALQFLIKSDEPYRDEGRWGSSGPHEVLTGYGGCTNCYDHVWHSARDKITTYKAHVQNVRGVILSALCDEQLACDRWRLENNIDLFTKLPFCRHYGNGEEQKAWDRFMALDRLRLPRSINPSHRDVKVLCYPELKIGKDGIFLTYAVSSISELRTMQECASRWDVGSLIHAYNFNGDRNPRWKVNRETFTQFIDRATEHFRNVQPRATVIS